MYVEHNDVGSESCVHGRIAQSDVCRRYRGLYVRADRVICDQYIAVPNELRPQVVVGFADDQAPSKRLPSRQANSVGRSSGSSYFRWIQGVVPFSGVCCTSKDGASACVELVLVLRIMRQSAMQAVHRVLITPKEAVAGLQSCLQTQQTTTLKNQ